MGFRNTPVSSPLRSSRMSIMCIALTLFLLCAAKSALGQLDAGSITGTLRDPSGAVIVGATVTIRNVATGVTTVLKTNSDGTYQALALIPGTYSVEASAAGFSTAKNATVEVHVKTRAEVDFNLVPGATTDMIEVRSDFQGLQTQTADVGNVIGTTQINDLPLNARRYADLALLEPGDLRIPVLQTPRRIVSPRTAISRRKITLRWMAWIITLVPQICRKVLYRTCSRPLMQFRSFACKHAPTLSSSVHRQGPL